MLLQSEASIILAGDPTKGPHPDSPMHYTTPSSDVIDLKRHVVAFSSSTGADDAAHEYQAED